MARKQIIFSFIAVLIVCSLSGSLKGQTSESGPNNFFYQYFPIISIPSPYPVYVKSYSEYTEGTSHFVVGELYNQTDTMYYNAGVTVEMIGPNHELIYRSIRTFIRCINPHQTTPFKVLFSGLPEPIQVSNISWFYMSSPEYPPCQSEKVESQDYGDYYGTEFFACVSNPTTKAIYGLTIAITMYDETGKVVGVEKTTFPNYSPPNNHDIYCLPEGIFTTYLSNQFSSFKAQAEGFTSEGDTFP